jgi:hypothetical protein
MKLRHFIKMFSIVFVSYAVLFSIAIIFFEFIFPVKAVEIRTLTTSDAYRILPVFLPTFLLTFGTLIYLFNSWLEQKLIKLKWSKILLYMGMSAGFGPTAEIIINSISRILSHQPIWLYQLLPVHGGDTSLVMSIIWPLYGFHIYCFHTALDARRDKNSDADLALFVGIDAIALEVFANLFTLSFFYTYIFYYLAGDLWHLSTIVIFVPYVVFGYFAIKILHLLEKKRHHVLFGVAGFLLSWLLIFVL